MKPIRKLTVGIVVQLLVATLVFSAAIAAADVTFTSTADFDAGTYTESSGNRETNSNSCNLGIAAGAIELDSLKGDSFCIADTDADTVKWDICERGDLTGSAAVTGGQMVLSIPANLASTQIAFRSASTYSGNSLDFRMRQNPIFTNQIESWWYIVNEQVCTFEDSGTNDGALYQILGRGTDYTLTAATINNAAATVCGVASAFTDNPIWRRILRTGASTWEFYFSTDGTAYTLDESCTQSVTGSVYSSVEVGDNAQNVAITYNFDDFHLASGTVDAGGFRSTGTWTSATQTWTSNVATSIVLTYSGATAANYIDSVAIVDSGGTAIFTDGTDITSGSSATILVTYTADLRQNWRLRIVLASAGAGTPTIETLLVTEGPSPDDGGGGGGFGGNPITIECTPQLLQLYCSAILAPHIAGILIVRTTWFSDGKFITNGTGDGRIQRAILPAQVLPRGNVTIRLITFFSNGQVLEKQVQVLVDNSWLILLILIGGMAGGIGILSIWISVRRPKKRGSDSRREYALWQRVFK